MTFPSPMAALPPKLKSKRVPGADDVATTAVVSFTNYSARKLLASAYREYHVLDNESEWIAARKVQLKRVIYETELLLSFPTDGTRT